MNEPCTIALIALLALPAAAVSQGPEALGSAQASGSLAPDGARGFGSDASPARLRETLGSKAAHDLEFVAELGSLEGKLRILLDAAAERYAREGYFALLPGSADPDARELHALWRRDSAEAFQRLASGEQAAVFARLFVDLELRLRSELLAGWEVDAAELSGSLALVSASLNGYVELREREARELGRRADLAAARLRALYHDLETLRGESQEQESGKPPEVLAATLVGLGRIDDEGARRETFERVREDLAGRQRRRAEELESRRLGQSLERELLRRDGLREQARASVTETRRILPDYPEGLEPTPEVAELSASKRYAFALRSALVGVDLDPFEPDLCYLAGHAASLLYGEREARKWFDRFLALKGIRSHDHRTYASRRLSSDEERALDLVLRAGR